MIFFDNCCMRFKWYSFYNESWIYIKDILNTILSMELFGNKDVKCSYNRINDLMYLDKKLNIITEKQFNEEYAEEYGYEPKTFDEEICKETSEKWFFEKGISVKNVFKLLK